MSFYNNSLADQLELYRQSGNICAFLNISQIGITYLETEKFAALDAAGFHLSSNSLLELLVPSSILRQFTVARCSYEKQLTLFNSKEGKYALVYAARESLYPVTSRLIVPASVAMLAVLFNISLLIVTARKISMSTVCNWLLAFDSFCQIPAMFPFLVNLFAYCARMDVIDYRVCLTSLMLSTGFSYAAFLAVYFISLERLLIVFMPMRMSQISEKTVKHCSLLAVVTCVCFGAAMVPNLFNMWTYTNKTFGSLLYCDNSLYSELLNLYYVTHAILGLALLNYVLIAGLICWRRIYVPSTRADSNNNAAYSQATHRMLRSVFLLSLVLLIGWLFGCVLRKQIEEFISMMTDKIGIALFGDLTKRTRFYVNFVTWAIGLTLCFFPVAAGINAPILIINNSDYREAYKKMLLSFRIPCRKRNSPAAIGPMFT